MLLYHNGTRFAAIITIKILAVQDPKKALSLGTDSAVNIVALDMGVHDLLVGPGESIRLEQGVDGQFLASRAAL